MPAIPLVYCKEAMELMLKDGDEYAPARIGCLSRAEHTSPHYGKVNIKTTTSPVPIRVKWAAGNGHIGLRTCSCGKFKIEVTTFIGGHGIGNQFLVCNDPNCKHFLDIASYFQPKPKPKTSKCTVCEEPNWWTRISEEGEPEKKGFACSNAGNKRRGTAGCIKYRPYV